METVIRPKKRPAKRPTATPPKPAMPDLATRRRRVTKDVLNFLIICGLVILTVGGFVFAVNVFGGRDGTVYVANTSIPRYSSNQTYQTSNSERKIEERNFSGFDGTTATNTSKPDVQIQASQPVYENNYAQTATADRKVVSECYLSNNGNSVNIRQNCDQEDCYSYPETIYGQFADGQKVSVLNERLIDSRYGFYWIPISFDNSVVYVASTKLYCPNQLQFFDFKN
jgi:hypothetical protein